MSTKRERLEEQHASPTRRLLISEPDIAQDVYETWECPRVRCTTDGAI